MWPRAGSNCTTRVCLCRPCHGAEAPYDTAGRRIIAVGRWGRGTPQNFLPFSNHMSIPLPLISHRLRHSAGIHRCQLFSAPAARYQRPMCFNKPLNIHWQLGIVLLATEPRCGANACVERRNFPRSHSRWALCTTGCGVRDAAMQVPDLDDVLSSDAWLLCTKKRSPGIAPGYLRTRSKLVGLGTVADAEMVVRGSRGGAEAFGPHGTIEPTFRRSKDP
ncbi:hypothetical protein B0T14DRAFT_251938 [Immersiella caudata]|uniref:Uncharacterized protein n=1 Tax=Immersiella caudata TaxID=314043 RepID=A0AA40BX14_9PEZI|nr:hypothetical protein B0T14DRAFT_251938 [Immersiella caudata]